MDRTTYGLIKDVFIPILGWMALLSAAFVVARALGL